MSLWRFKALLERPSGTGTMTYLIVPFDVEKVFRVKSRVPVKGTIDGATFRSSLMPWGDGRHYIVVNKSIRDIIGKSAGDEVEVTVEKDTEPRVAAVPEDFKLDLAGNKTAQQFFSKLAYSHQKSYLDWIEDAKKNSTRQNRIRKTVEKLSREERLK
ncbi:MAG: YdeI/OmpD-associated family protein [Thaumarchaeota archaeon]|nr:YdeI/OmpD-associated family protein [Nitrososphaerota archaeon]MCL5318029.1 YdeI/OmpD-associated family protein [Nitrososphaerota archaeon]